MGGRNPSYSSGVLGSFFKTRSLLTARSWAALPCSERPTALQCPSSQPRSGLASPPARAHPLSPKHSEGQSHGHYQGAVSCICVLVQPARRSCGSLPPVRIVLLGPIAASMQLSPLLWPPKPLLQPVPSSALARTVDYGRRGKKGGEAGCAREWRARGKEGGRRGQGGRQGINSQRSCPAQQSSPPDPVASR